VVRRSKKLLLPFFTPKTTKRAAFLGKSLIPSKRIQNTVDNMGSDQERTMTGLLKNIGFEPVIRAAGSLGLDLATRNKYNQFIGLEEKSRGEDRFGNWKYYPSNTKKDKKQYREAKQMVKNGVPLIIPVRWLGYPDHHGTPEWEKWEVFLIQNEEKHKQRANQKWPSFTLGDGIEPEPLLKKLYKSKQPNKTLSKYIE